jgi:hypothetical protein
VKSFLSLLIEGNHLPCESSLPPNDRECGIGVEKY